ncbi:DISARM system helicase DrmA [Streptosporangium sp. NBC_01755]|uniref:DISARM system helicase DrmA n=1 Tax=unclassified Streptosporangium TaxID=2632669 RepID=UPI002DD834CE|nr:MULTISPECIES: DISARM system helicase DrmA [unclassified Streptosporangium]WSA26795.1 DISARM system helicase DrmA [Streptosporangium sp. NBC_01810]WSD01780.1 DISARM system helicase DrmA [Streptosporangium sp. NBC_01755]
MPPGLDTSQAFEQGTSFQVRDAFEELVRRDLLGPWDGDGEELPRGTSGPRERYLVGMLGPKPSHRSAREDAGEMPETEIGVEGDGAEGELPEVLTPQNLGRIWASSMGLSFAVPGEVDALAVVASWGRYTKTETMIEDAKGRERTASTWTRKQVDHRKTVRLDGEPSQRIPLTMERAEDPGVLLAVAVRPQRDGRRVVELTLINQQIEPERTPDVAWLFQAGLTVTAPGTDVLVPADGDAASGNITAATAAAATAATAADPHATQAADVFLPIDDPVDDLEAVGDDLEERHLRLLYRHERRYASGRNVAVHAEVAQGERCARELRTTWLPAYDVPATVAPVGKGTALAEVELSMDVLAMASPEDLAAGLHPLADGYAAWLDGQRNRIPDLPEPLREVAKNAVYKAEQAARRIRDGVELLTDPGRDRHDQALAAFRFANTAMAAQRRRTTVGKLRDELGLSYPQAMAKVEAQGESAASWRPFQLAFVLLNLPSLTDPEHAERAADASATVDLLFFPTGGGKTEAYLGLTAYTFAIRRLQGTVGSGADARDGRSGVSVLMRYTLRLLTAQQFQRAAALVCAAEVQRRADPATWGEEPFRIGLWVGGAVSPNWFTEAADQIHEAREAPAGRRTNVLQTLTCPWCGEKLTGDRNLFTDDDRRRVLLYCGRGREGEADPCPFSRIGEDRMLTSELDDAEEIAARRDGMPILTVDEEIYRLVPSLVIATVDKLAQLPWRGFAGHLFGRVSQRCPRHGYRHTDLDEHVKCGAKHHAKGKLPKVVSRPVLRLRTPDLIIQDELHLISGALGTTVGLFEAAVDELCTWSPRPGTLTGPKIIASTATTKRAERQVLGVFGRRLAVFPPQVIDVTDTFFSRQVPLTEKTPGRRYLGVCAHGTRLKSAEIRLAEILFLAGQTMFDRYGEPADPYMTVVGYFNATRELAGMRRYLDDDVTTRIRTHGRRKGIANRLSSPADLLTVVELTSRISSGDISEVLKQLEIGFDQETDTSGRRYAIRAEWADVLKEKNKEKRRNAHPLAERQRRRGTGRQPVDAVLATSMLQVGVDVSRFGLMVVTGQPKNTAEYIQASSRVGRDAERPGLVITLYNWSRPRDLAHYEDFEHYHATFYRQVEALSVTPYTRRALDRGTAAMFVAAVRNAEESYSRNRDAEEVPLSGPVVGRIVDRLLTRAEAAGDVRARDYLAERIKVVTDSWEQAKGSAARLGYEQRKSTKQEIVLGLLNRAGNGRWDALTVGNSMRETENELNLLLPGSGDIFAVPYGAPAWTFQPSDADGTGVEVPEGDEMGVSELNGKGK